MTQHLGFFCRRSCLVAALIAGGCTEGIIGEPTGALPDDPNRGAAQPVAAPLPMPAPPSTTTLDGHWYLNVAGRRVTVSLAAAGGGPRRGSVADDGATTPARDLSNLRFDDARQELTFSEQRGGGDFVHYRLRPRDGVTTGRFAATSAPAAPLDPAAFTGQLVGWRDESLSAGIVPRVFDILIGGRQRAIVRIDRSAPDGGFVGRFKVYATNEVLDEQLSEDVEVTAWDGRTLRFLRPARPTQDQFTGTAVGRTISGTVTTSDGTAQAFTGTRAEVLGHGLVARSAKGTQEWQARTRERLAWLAMAGNPAPSSLRATEIGRYAPIPEANISANRDDSLASWPAAYQLHEIYLDATLPSPSGGSPLSRRAHAVLAVPTTPAPPGGFPVAIAINGHWGSAWRTFDPQGGIYWYGDSFARRGFVVIAVDVGHRPLGDRKALYADITDGDDPAAGNGTHPAIKDPGLDSEWEEDGERAWDVMRGIDHVLARPDVDRRHVTVVGLSMGGEVTEWVGAMDQRVQTIVNASGPPDLSVIRYHGNHPCWAWQRGDAREFFDPGDLDGLAAPRTLVRETGMVDATYSSLTAPFAGDKQSVRRVRPVFDVLGGRLVHYLHYDAHTFHVGELGWGASGPALGVTTPMVITQLADAPWSTTWEIDESTEELTPSLYNEIQP